MQWSILSLHSCLSLDAFLVLSSFGSRTAHLPGFSPTSLVIPQSSFLVTSHTPDSLILDYSRSQYLYLFSFCLYWHHLWSLPSPGFKYHLNVGDSGIYVFNPDISSDLQTHAVKCRNLTCPKLRSWSSFSLLHLS